MSVDVFMWDSFIDPQIFTDFHRLHPGDFGEVLKDRKFPVLQAGAKLVLPLPAKWKFALLQRLRQNHFQARLLDEICENLWKSVDKKEF